MASGAAGGGVAHEALSAIAVPPLVVLVLAAWLEYRRLLVPTSAALVLFGVAALVTGRVPHIVLAALAFAASLVSAALVLRERWVPAGSWRDYVALTKPRIMTLLLLTGLCGMIVGAGGWPATWLVLVTMLGLALACGGASALNHVLDRDIDREMRRTSAARSRPNAFLPSTRSSSAWRSRPCPSSSSRASSTC